MKILKISFLAVAVVSLVFFAGCKKDKKEDGEREVKINLLVSHSPWNLTNATVPGGTATENGDWENFSVTFTNTNMTRTGFPAGAGDVWPASSWTLSDDLTKIVAGSREYTISTLTSSTFQVSFVVPEEVELGARTAALGGNYNFTFGGSN